VNAPIAPTTAVPEECVVAQLLLSAIKPLPSHDKLLSTHDPLRPEEARNDAAYFTTRSVAIGSNTVGVAAHMPIACASRRGGRVHFQESSRLFIKSFLRYFFFDNVGFIFKLA
jgi:hypothetical protein